MTKRIFSLFLSLLACSSPAFSGAEDKYPGIEDGSVRIQGHRFVDMKSYVRSEYFRKEGKRCGTKPPVLRAEKTAMAKSVEDCTEARTIIQSEYWTETKTYVMPVWFHVITRFDGYGDITDAGIKAQVQVLNEDFGAVEGSLGEKGVNTRIQFELAGITRTANENWFYEDSLGDDELQFKTELHKDLEQYVNIYTNIPAGGDLGYSYYPQTTAGEIRDGIVLLHSTVGGRDNGFPDYNQGRTLVHEMGHYLGLLHTFANGAYCGNSYIRGDLILDTPAEMTAHYDCTQTYTCGTADPIHNYMNYTNDLCVNNFSSEQANRTVCSLINYRPKTYRVISELPDFAIPPLIQPLLLNE